MSLILHNFPKTLDRTITFNSVTLKNTQTELKRKIFQQNELADKIEKIILDFFFF